uniref:Histidine kinase 1-like isoform X2 n=1 Tax=Tanacetum cinerariifolium TaxID=118510 RepID=A0A699GF19_TANCI|nr:histidine kinase 1-like isoform X2 [Tanacetum cinerariifolium]
MGGAMFCTSAPGAGSTFGFDLPARVVEAPAIAVAAVAAPAAVAVPSGRRVLLVEDTEMNRQLARILLRKLGWTVDEVHDGQQALDALAAARYDLVLMDCMMPVMDGYEACRRLRAREAANGWPHTPVIALTANAIEGDRDRCLAAGADDYLTKPFTATAFAETIHRCTMVDLPHSHQISRDAQLVRAGNAARPGQAQGRPHPPGVDRYEQGRRYRDSTGGAGRHAATASATDASGHRCLRALRCPPGTTGTAGSTGQPCQHRGGTGARGAHHRPVAHGRHQHVCRHPHGPHRRPGAGHAAGRGNLGVRAAQCGRAGEPGAPEAGGRLHVPALGGRVRHDGGAGAPAGPGRGAGAPLRHGRPAARRGQDGRGAGTAQQAGQADGSGIYQRQAASAQGPRPAAAVRECAPDRARRVPAPPRTHRRRRLSARPARRSDQPACAHGRDLRRVRRHHVQPSLQGGLEPGRLAAPHGRVDPQRPSRSASVCRVRQVHRHLPAGHAGAAALGAPGRGHRQQPLAAGARGAGLLFDPERRPYRARNHRPDAARRQGRHCRLRGAGHLEPGRPQSDREHADARPAPQPHGPGLQDPGAGRPRRRARVLRFHHLRVFRHHHRRPVLPARHARLAAPVPDLRHLRGRLRGAPARRHGHGPLRRPAGPQKNVQPVDPADGRAHAADRHAAHLRRHRPGRAVAAAVAARGAGRGRGRRGARRLGVRVRARAGAPYRLRVRHADGRPHVRHPARLADGHGHQHRVHAAAGARLRLARAVSAGRPVRPDRHVPAALAARDARVRRAPAAPRAGRRTAAQGRAARTPRGGGRVDAADVDAVGRHRGGDPDDARAAAESVRLRRPHRAAGQHPGHAVPGRRLRGGRGAGRPRGRAPTAGGGRAAAGRVHVGVLHHPGRAPGPAAAAVCAAGVCGGRGGRGARRDGARVSGARALFRAVVLVQPGVCRLRRPHAHHGDVDAQA